MAGGDIDEIDIGVIDVVGAPSEPRAEPVVVDGRGRQRQRQRPPDDDEDHYDDEPTGGQWKKYLVPIVAGTALLVAVGVVILPKVAAMIGGGAEPAPPPITGLGQQPYGTQPPYVPPQGGQTVLAPTTAAGLPPAPYGGPQYGGPQYGAPPTPYQPPQQQQQLYGGQPPVTPPAPVPQLNDRHGAVQEPLGGAPTQLAPLAAAAPQSPPQPEERHSLRGEEAAADRARLVKLEADVAQLANVLGVILGKVDDVALRMGKVDESVGRLSEGLQKPTKEAPKPAKAVPEAPKAKAKAAAEAPSHAATAPPSVAWKLGGVAGNNAWLSNERGEMRQVSVGQDLESLGKVLAIEMVGGRWVLRAEKGSVSQR